MPFLIAPRAGHQERGPAQREFSSLSAFARLAKRKRRGEHQFALGLPLRDEYAKCKAFLLPVG
jgi:hypothetical protein